MHSGCFALIWLQWWHLLLNGPLGPANSVGRQSMGLIPCTPLVYIDGVLLFSE